MAQSHGMVEAVNAFAPEYEALSDDALREKTHAFRNRLAGGETESELLPEVFAAVRESARRSVKLRHFDVQLVGGLVLNNRGIAEMKTGEGKTLVATLPAYLNALWNKGVHIVTVNDYLARRDAAWMGQGDASLGMSGGGINQDAAYRHDAGHKEIGRAAGRGRGEGKGGGVGGGGGGPPGPPKTPPAEARFRSRRPPAGCGTRGSSPAGPRQTGPRMPGQRH